MDATAFGQPLVIDHLPEGFVPLEAVVVVKGLAPDGTLGVFQCATDGLTSWEALDMVIACADAFRAAIRNAE